MSTFSRDIIVRFAHCDAAGLIFYPRLLGLVNEMVEDFFAGPLGVSFKALHIERRKGAPTVSLDSTFLAPIRLGDNLTQRLRIEEIGATSCRLGHEAHVGDKLAARFDQVIVHVDLEAMKAEPWPEDLRAGLARFAEGP